MTFCTAERPLGDCKTTSFWCAPMTFFSVTQFPFFSVFVCKYFICSILLKAQSFQVISRVESKKISIFCNLIRLKDIKQKNYIDMEEAVHISTTFKVIINEEQNVYLFWSWIRRVSFFLGFPLTLNQIQTQIQILILILILILTLLSRRTLDRWIAPAIRTRASTLGSFSVS